MVRNSPLKFSAPSVAVSFDRIVSKRNHRMPRARNSSLPGPDAVADLDQARDIMKQLGIAGDKIKRVR